MPVAIDEALKRLDKSISESSYAEHQKNIRDFVKIYGEENLPDIYKGYSLKDSDIRIPKKTPLPYGAEGLYLEDLSPEDRARYAQLLAKKETAPRAGISLIPEEVERVVGKTAQAVVGGTLELGEFAVEALPFVDKLPKGAKEVKRDITSSLASYATDYNNMEIDRDEDGVLYYKIKEPKTGAGQLASGVGTFVANYFGGKKLFLDAAEGMLKKQAVKKGVGRPKKDRISDAARLKMAGAASTFTKAEYAAQTSLDPQDGRFAYYLGEYLGDRSDLAKEIFDYIDLEDPAELSEAENRLGMLAENLLLVGGIGTSFALGQAGYKATRESVVKALKEVNKKGPAAKQEFKKTVNKAAQSPNARKTDPNLIKAEQDEAIQKSLMLSNNPIIRGIQQIGKKLTSEGYYTEEMFNIIKSSEKAKIAWAARAENLATNLQNQLDKLAKNKIFKDQNIDEFVTNILSGQKNIKKTKYYQNLPDNIKLQLTEIRTTIDDLSSQLLQTKGISQELKDEIQKNMGSYLRTSYRKFQDKDYTPTQQVFDDAVEYIFKQTKGTQGFKSLTDKEVRDRAVVQVKNLLNTSDGKTYQQFLDDALKGKRNANIVYQNKKQFAPEIKALLGEEKNISTRIFRTVEQMSKDIHDAKLYEDLYQAGKGVYFFTERQGAKLPPAKEYLQRATIEGTKFGSLNGKKTTPELAEMFISMDRQSKTGLGVGVLKSFLLSKGLGQAAATVGNLYTHLRNTYGQATIMLSNGLNPFAKETGDAFKVLNDRIKKGGDRELQKIYEDFLELGVVNQSVQVGDFKRLINVNSKLKFTNSDPIATSRLLEKDGILKTVYQSGKQKGELIADEAKKKFNLVTDIYIAEDDLFRIATFNKELKVLQRAEKLKPKNQQRNLQELRQEAATIVRNTLPTYELVPVAARQLRNLPVGNFFSFHAERFRNTYETYKRAATEIRSGNEELIRRGIDRLAGKVLYGAMGTTGLHQASKLMFGVTAEDDKRYKDLIIPDFARNSEIVYFRTPDNDLYYLDTQFTDPDAPVNNFTRGILRELTDPNTPLDSPMKRITDATAEGMKSFFTPFVDEALLTERIIDTTFRPERIRGLKEDDVMNNLIEKFKYVSEVVIPQSLRQLYQPDKLGNAIYREITEENPVNRYGKPIDSRLELLTNATGLRFNKIDNESLERSVGFKLRNLNNSYRNLSNDFTSLLRKAEYDNSVTFEDIIEEYRRVNTSYYKEYVKAVKVLESADYFDLNKNIINEAINTNLTNLSKDEKNTIKTLKNNFQPIDLSSNYRNFITRKLRREGKKTTTLLNDIYVLENTMKELPILDLENVTDEDMKIFDEVLNISGVGGAVLSSIGERLPKVTGGLVEGTEDVPYTEEDPADRINPYTGESYSGKTELEKQMEELI